MVHADGSVLQTYEYLKQHGLQGFKDIWPVPSLTAWKIIASFGAFEALLQIGVPGKRFEGPVFPTGNVPVYKVDVSEIMGGDTISNTLPRMPGPAKDYVRSNTNNRPFRPRSLVDSQSVERIRPEGARNGDWVREVIDGGIAQSVSPGFKKGIDLGYLKEYPLSLEVCQQANCCNTGCYRGEPGQLLLDKQMKVAI